jgi:undecaprenyl pyrophosphate phosphatase UppP
MIDMHSFATSHTEFVYRCSTQYARRFAVSLLLTCVEAGFVGYVVSSVFSNFFITPILCVIFTILVMGLMLSLVRMWFLTFMTVKSRPTGIPAMAREALL